MKSFLRRHWLGVSILVSLIAHLLLFSGAGVYLMLRGALFPSAQAKQQSPDVKPLSFTLVESPRTPAPENQQDNPKYLSDKTARAQNELADEDLPLDDPLSNGIASIPQMPEKPGNSQPANPANTQKVERQQGENEPDASAGYTHPARFSRQDLIPSPSENSSQSSDLGELRRAAQRNRKTRARNSGTFSFSTYDWDFAPYMLKLKRTLERKNNPPAAFRELGMISGKTTVVFRILPDGMLDRYDVLGSQGHKSLRTTAVNAVRASAPFDPLPNSFPEEFLEVTVRFEYNIIR